MNMARLSVQTPEMLEKHLFIADEIATNLKRKYPWCNKDEIYSYSLWGLTIASLLFDESIGGSFAIYAKAKGYFLAVDEMRKDRLIVKKSHLQGGYLSIQKRINDDIVDYHQSSADNDVDTMDEVTFLLDRLSEDDRELLRLHYGKGLNFSDIGISQGRSESAICVRHRVILDKLRHRHSSDNSKMHQLEIA